MWSPREVCAAVALIASLGAAGAAAQEQSYFYLDRSAIFYSPGNRTVFEAQIAPQLVVHETVSDLFTGTTASGWRRGWSVSVSPMVRLRMAATRSKPITPASFMPHGVGQVSWLRSTSDATDELERLLAQLEMWTVSLRFSHHSNGQQGCLYTTQALQTIGGEDVCVFAPAAGPDPSAINFDDGTFSTNFVRPGVFYRRLRPEQEQANWVDYSWYAGAEVELHTGPGLDQFPGALPDDQRPLYGTWRWYVHAGSAFRRGEDGSQSIFTDLRFMHAPNVGDGIPSWAIEGEVYWLFERFGGWGLYARLYHGQDFYNLYFVEEMTRLHLGLAWVQDRLADVALAPLG